MTEIHDQIIDHPSAWIPTQLDGRRSLQFLLSQKQLGAIDAVLENLQQTAPQAGTRDQFGHPEFAKLAGDLREIIMNGRGLVLVTGLDPARYSPTDMEKIFWGIGTYLGIASQEHENGSRLAYVQEEMENPTARGHRSSAELRLHSDSFEVMGLMCIEKAPVGGDSTVASALTIHNEILRTRPDLLPPLYEGFYELIRELRFTDRAITEKKIPIFCAVDGIVSCLYRGSAMRGAAKKMNVSLPGKLAEALDYFEAIAARPDISMTFTIEPGEMLLAQNFVHLHARTSFENSPDRRRLLIRLHCDVPNGGRPVRPELLVNSELFAWYWREGIHQKVA